MVSLFSKILSHQLVKEGTTKRDPKILPISPTTLQKAPKTLKALNAHKEENKKLRKASGPGAEDADDGARQDFWGSAPQIFHSPFTCALYST